MSAPTVTELLALGELRHRDPEHVRRRSEELLLACPPDGAVRATAMWVHGLALHELGRPADAVGLLRTAVRLAERAGDAATAAAARSSLAMSLLTTGAAAAALRELNRARTDTPRAAIGTVEPLWGVFLQRTGRLDEALEVFDRILPVLLRDGDQAGAARTLLNRGTLLAYQGRFPRAAKDLADAERLATTRQLWLLAAMAAHNLGFTEGRRNAIPAGLAGFDRARAAYHAVGDPPRQVAVLAADHCELLLRAGLARDARIGAERALAMLASTSGVDASHETEIRLLLAQALLADGDPAAASTQAAIAAQGFRAGRRPAWAALADYVSVNAEIAAHEEKLRPPAELLGRTQWIARALEANGWPVEALHARTLLGRVALALDRADIARRELRAAAGTRRRGTVDARTTAWHATALLRLADGDRAGAKRALRRGLTLVEEYRGTLTTTELRVGAAVRGAELARAGLRLALADGRPLEVLRWAERWRAGALRLPPVTPPADAQLAAATTALHSERADLQDATLSGRSTRPHRRRISQLEAEIRARTLRAGSGAAVAASGLDVGALRRALDPTVLVEYVALEGRLAAITLRSGRARLHDLGDVEKIRIEITYLTSILRRALTDPARGLAQRTGAATSSSSRATAERLEGMILSPLGIEVGAPLVVVPTGPLHGLAWAALPALSGRRLVVAPSADLWLRRRRAHQTAVGASVALAAGPDLRGAVEEIDALARAYPGAHVLRGREATVAAVLGLFARCDLVHVAAHGRFRADSPLFSSLQLADGALTVFDMEHLPSAPSTVVLPACEAGRTEVLVGDELLGTTTALLGRGVRSVIAPVLPVPDAATSDLMILLHRRLQAGEPPSLALAAAAADLPEDDPALIVASTFVCLGAAED